LNHRADVGSVAVLDIAPGARADTIDRMGLRLQGEQRGYHLRRGVDVRVVLHLGRNQRVRVFVGVGGERPLGNNDGQSKRKINGRCRRRSQLLAIPGMRYLRSNTIKILGLQLCR